VTGDGRKNTVAHFWEWILQFGQDFWESAGKFSRIIKKINSSVMSGAKRPKLES
jgi:hypothetical protein